MNTRVGQHLIGLKLKRLFTAAGVFWPIAVGGLGLALHGPPDGLLSWGMAAALVWGVGTAAYRWFVDGDGLTESALAELRQRARREQFTYLNRLRRQLRTDRDPRTNQLARRLHDLYDRSSQFDPQYSRRAGSMSRATAELFDQAHELYGSCVALLERSFQLWRSARDMATDSARQQLLDTRERLIQEVGASVQHLEDSLDRLQTLQLEHRDLGETENARLRGELQTGLDVARQVERRMEELERDLQVRLGS